MVVSILYQYTQQNSSCTATYHPPRKLSKLDKPDMQHTAGEVWTNPEVIYSRGLLHMDEQRQENQWELIYNSSEPIQNIAWKTSRKRWTGETGGRATCWWWWWWWLKFSYQQSSHCLYVFFPPTYIQFSLPVESVIYTK